MASPFRTFRKNQKAWMVVITILAMVSFVFFSQTGSRQSGPTGGQDPEVFTWKYGTVRQSDINNRKYLRTKLNQFLVRTGQAADVPIQRIAQSQYPTTEQSIINTMLLAKKAEQLGIVITDAMVRSYIRAWTEDKVRREDLAGIIQGLSSEGGGISQSQLFDQIRFELAAQQAMRLFAPLLVRGDQGYFWFAGDTPAERWDYYCRLNRKVTAEIMPVSVRDFVDKVPEPSASELQSFYDLYKNDYPDAGSPTPGFKQPYKAQFEYVKADNARLIEEALPTVTEQEIKNHYEKFKDTLYKKGHLPDWPEKTDAEKSGGEKTDDAAGAASDKNGETKSAEKAATKPDEKSSTTKGDAKAKDSTPPDSKKSDSKAPESKSGAKSSGSKSGKADAKGPAGGTKSGDAKKSTDAKQSSNRSSSRQSLNGELLALADDAAIELAQKSTDTAKKDAKGDTKSQPKADTKAPDTKATDTKATDTKATDAKATDAKATDAKATDAKATDAKATDAKATDAKAIDAKATDQPIEYEPFDKVSGMIRNRIAQQKVDEKVASAFRNIQMQMDQYRSSLDRYRALQSQGNTSGKKPQPPDLEALAKPYGFAVKKTELVSMQQVYDGYDIGKSHQPVAAGNYNAPPFYQVAYQVGTNGQPAVKLFQTSESEDAENNQYLWWKIADAAANVPPLEAIKPDVVTAWKIVQARAPAIAKANQDAAEVQKSHESLKQAFGNSPGVEVVTEGPFSWLTRTLDQSLRLSTIKGVELAGTEFMKSVFSLKQGETGVAANQPQTVFYVVQIESEEPTTDSLRETFMMAMSDPMNRIVYAAVAAGDQRSSSAAWFKELADEFDFKMALGRTASQSQEID